jgi:hypothetical protein
VSGEDCVCARCHRDYSLRENCEPSKYCDACVHDVLAAAERVIDAARAMYPHARSRELNEALDALDRPEP